MQHSSSFLELVNKLKPSITECHIDDVKSVIDSGDTTVIVDVRETEEWDQGFIPGSIHLSKGVIERDIERMFPDKNTHLILYCGGGYRSVIAADLLQKMGYTNVKSLAGGIAAWVNAGLPLDED